jgi:hypothetical protein
VSDLGGHGFDSLHCRHSMFHAVFSTPEHNPLFMHEQQCTLHCLAQVKALFPHAVHCKAKLAGSCSTCKNMFWLLQLHASDQEYVLAAAAARV